MNWRDGHDQYGEIWWSFEIFEIVTFVRRPKDFGATSIREES
jgi:hypothetical protein